LRKHAKNCGPLGLGGRHVLLNGGVENSLRRGRRLRVSPWDSGDKDEQNRENGRGRSHARVASCCVKHSKRLQEFAHRRQHVWPEIGAGHEADNFTPNKIRSASTHLVADERQSLWLAALEDRHLANLRVAEVTRALRALSSAYVERRHKVASGSTLDSAGKRAAFALYYGPLHFIATAHVLRLLDAGKPRQILDVGCGTGTVGAAWALHAGGAAVTGIDRHPWAVDEARLTYRDLGLTGSARVGDASRLPVARGAGGSNAFVLGYVLNELPPEARARVEAHLLDRAADGSSILILEPISKAVAPWWGGTAEAFARVGGRVHEWKLQPDIPDIVALLGKGAGLNYRELRLRSIYVPAR